MNFIEMMEANEWKNPKEVDYNATKTQLKKICEWYQSLLSKRTSGRVTAQESEMMAELERVYHLLPLDYQTILSNWLEPKARARSDISIYIGMGLTEKFYYREKQKAIIEFAEMLGVAVYRE